MIIQPLKGHDRSQFSCGNADLDTFLKVRAGQHQRFFASQTYVGIVADELVGFLTVTMREFKKDDAAGELAKHPPFPLPVLLLARLAIDQRAQRKGLGERFVVYVCQLARTLRDAVGCVGVLVDSKPGSVGFYERLGFVHVDGGSVGLERMLLPMTRIPDEPPRDSQ